MRQLLALLAVAAVLTCGGAGYIPPGYLPGDPSTEQIVRRVVAHAYFNSWQEWSHSPYFRMADNMAYMPVYVFIDQSGYGCVVPAEIWTLQPPRIACPEGWRLPRYDASEK